MNNSTDKPIDMEEQDLLGRFIFQNSLGRQFMIIMKNRTKTYFSKKVDLNKCAHNLIKDII